MNLPIPISEFAAKALSRSSIEEPFEIQSLAAELVFQGNSVKIMAPTGSGKTLSYLLPAIAAMEKDSELKLIILSSSPELASQIHSEVKKYCNFTSALILGAANIHRQKEKLKKKPRVLVGTPGRMFELFCIERFTVTAKTILILDEIDTLLEGPSFDKVFCLAEGCGQLITASATYGDDADQFIAKIPHELLAVQTSKREGSVHHAYMFCNPDKKEISLIKLLRERKLKKVLLFINNLKYSSHLISQLKSEGIPHARLDSKVQKIDREKAVNKFRSGEVEVLVTSDSLARGIDFESADVIQYNIARDADVYTHRSGRAGRAGKTGLCVSLVTAKNSYLLKKLSKKLSIEFEEISFNSGRRKSTKSGQKNRKKSASGKKRHKSK